MASKETPSQKKDMVIPVEVSDSDIYEAMKDVEGYLDVTATDLKEVYRHAFRHAMDRITVSVKAKEIMTTVVHAVRTDTSLKAVAELMAEKGISGLPVLDDTGRVAGVISEKDFLARMGASDRAHVMAIIAARLGGKEYLTMPNNSTTASDIMASPAITVHEECSVFEIIDLFNKKNINRVPVVDSSGKLTGIVSRADILRAKLIGQQ
jgi:CBS domain-containing membrane protein